MTTISGSVGIILSALIFWYYVDGVFAPRRTKKETLVWIIIGYGLLLGIMQLNIPPANLLGCIAVNLIILWRAFDNTFRAALFHTLILTVLMMAGEIAVSLLVNVQIDSDEARAATESLRALHAFFSKFIYFVAIALIRRVFRPSFRRQDTHRILILLIMPVTTLFVIMLVNDIMVLASNIQRMMLTIVSAALIAANIIVYWVYDTTVMKNSEIERLREEIHKNELDYEGYKQLQSQYTKTRELAHDLKNHFALLDTLLRTGNTDEMKVYLKSLENEYSSGSVTVYTNNKMLDIIISRKKEDAYAKRIGFVANGETLNINYIEDCDIVAIFANLLDNAIEHCTADKDAKIVMSFSVLNNAFNVVKITNRALKAPKVVHGEMVSTKKTDGVHGIGLQSVKHTLEKYKGELRFDYDEKEHTFSAKVLLPIK